MARTLGRTRKELLASIDTAELNEWWVLYQREPWGESRADDRAAATLFRNAAMRVGARVDWEDCIPDFWKPEEPAQTAEDHIRIGLRLAALSQHG